ncbi:AraC family transcriptional regulator [Cohnella boryungensis]|uniref:AraC family transcriptional regulator n=1 Tax=Cohnella boryungensis TaxID=768479 RepID=A0ABV8SCW8_9BACL
MNWNEHILLWNQAAVRVLDIRHQMRVSEEGRHAFLLPSSAFLFATQGSACVWLDGEPNRLRRYHLLHGGKGTSVEIVTAAEPFAYYLIFYKAMLPFPVSSSLRQLAEELGPFRTIYHAAPPEPFSLYEKVRRMELLWRQGKTLDQFRVKSLFYEFVHELLRQLSVNEAAEGTPDMVMSAMRYIDEHYPESIGIQDLADMLACSVSYIARIFKAQVGTSPIDYLIHVRIEQAKQRLASSESSLQSIALSVGYSDVYYFSRLFKKQTGVSPAQFRKKILKEQQVQHNPLSSSTFSIVPKNRFLYSDIDNENQYHQKGEVQLDMLRNTRPSMAAAMLLCLTLLISACQTGGSQANNLNNGASPASQATTTQSAQPENGTASPEGEKQTAPMRTFKHLHGETEIPEQPQRIVTAFHVGQLLALGVRPLGSSTYILQNPALDTTGMEDLGVPLSLEKITELEPDLIILIEAYVEMSGGYEAFSKIAPTIVIEPYYDPIKDIALMGDILGKQAEAENWIKEFEEKIAVSKQKVNEVLSPDESFTIMSVFEKSPRIYRDQNMGGNIIYKYLGLKPNEKVLSDLINNKEQAPPYKEVSAEVIPEFVGDRLIVATNEETKAAFESFQGTGLWANLAPVKNNKVEIIDYDLFLQNDPIAVTKQLELLTELLVK